LKQYEKALSTKAKSPAPLQVWQAYCQALFASAEFRYLN
jgi:hypothetical protein